MGATLAHHAPPVVQAAFSTLVRARLELVVAGLDGSGKTTLVRTLRRQPPSEPMPTTGLVFHRTRRSGISLQIWDLGGGRRFRPAWARRAQTCDALLFVVDCSEAGRLPEARQALHDLLGEMGRRGLPALILANKVDLVPPEARGSDETAVCTPIIRALGLDDRTPCDWCVLSISGRAGFNLDKALRWLVLQAHARKPRRPQPAEAEADAEAAGGGGGVWQQLHLGGRALERRLGQLSGRRYVSVATLRGALLDDADDLT